jgi:BirA family biotin operon repressor/biotin-[acetyl-CoA-carboxylase] ligase
MACHAITFQSDVMVLEPISSAKILKCLKTRVIGRDIIYRSSVSSTMDIALDEVLRDAPHGTVIVAEVQKNGKGRLDHEWVSPCGGVYVSIILYPPRELLASVTMIAALAVTDCIQDVSRIKADLKWPNDILIERKKVGGILSRSGDSPSKGCYAILGIGINADVDITAQPEIADIATSLSAGTGAPVSRQAIICSLLENLEKWYQLLSEGRPVWQDWRERITTLGYSVAVKTGDALYEGIAESVDSKGNLLVRQANKELISIPAGDVTLKI